MTDQSPLLSRYFEEKHLFSALIRIWKREIPPDKEPAFLCIGTDRSSGDAFGPLTGTLLKQMRVENVFGTLDRPVCARNLTEVYSSISKNKFVIAIDASLGGHTDLGFMTVRKSPLLPGTAMHRDLPPVGDLSVILNVNIAGISNYLFLQTASLYMVWKSANTLARSISTSLYIKKKNISVL